MLLTITYTGANTPDLGYLLYKNPARPQAISLSFGQALVFYPEVSDTRTTVALLLDVDPIDLARGKVGSTTGGLFDYVNDRPYVSSSFMSTAITKAFGTAMSGRGDAHQDLADAALDLTATVTMLPCRADHAMLGRVFEPLGYAVSYESLPTDEAFPDWGPSPYVTLTIRGTVRLRDLLRHLYVLLPVFDRRKHYWVGPAEVDKLLAHASDWLADHPEKAYITARYLARRHRLVNLALGQLTTAEAADDEDEPEPEDRAPNLNTQRLAAVVGALKAAGAHRVIDLGCGEGNLIRALIDDPQFSTIAGTDVSPDALEWTARKLKLDRAGAGLRDRVSLFQSSLTYRDARFSGYDAAAVVEVIEHLDPSRLGAFEKVVFEYAKPPIVVLTTPNREYNVHYGLAGDESRHTDHRFEWTRAEFRDWATRTAETYGYTVTIAGIGDDDEATGTPTQMGVFTCA